MAAGVRVARGPERSVGTASEEGRESALGLMAASPTSFGSRLPF